jgi:chromosomal replication initiation ATPase DnaA
MELIDRRIAAHTNVAVERLRWAGRGKARTTRARHLSLYLAVTEAGLSQSTVAALTGRHRTTIAHALRRTEDRREADPALDRALDVMADLVQRDLKRFAEKPIAAPVDASAMPEAA